MSLEFTINKIKDYIIKTYPKSCLAYNYNEAYHNEVPEELIEECEKFFYYEKLNWCGCGDPNTVKTIVRNFLQSVEIKMSDGVDIGFQKYFNVHSIYDNDLLLCLAYTIDAAGFTEHGSSIGGAWLTDEGKMFLWLLCQNKELGEIEKF